MSHEIAGKMLARTADLTGVGDPLTDITAKFMLALTLPDPCFMNLSIGLVECPHNMTAGFPQSE